MLAWIILAITALIQYIVITRFVFPALEYWSDASRNVEFNFIPPLLLNIGLLFYSFARLAARQTPSE
jgi:hypothetical protein